MSSSNGTSPRLRKHVDPATLEHAQRKARRRTQFREASRRKRARKSQKLAVLQAPSSPRKILHQLASGEFPDSRPVEALCKLGLTNVEICSVLGVSVGTFIKWQKMSPRLRASVERGRRVADTHVAESLYMQAVGFSVPEEKIFYNSRTAKVTRVDTMKYHAPSVVAAIFWLKNRYAEFWSDHKESDGSQSGLPKVVQQVKFVIVQAPSGSSQSSQAGEKVIDGDYQILSPGYGSKDSPPGDGDEVSTDG